MPPFLELLRDVTLEPIKTIAALSTGRGVSLIKIVAGMLCAIDSKKLILIVCKFNAKALLQLKIKRLWPVTGLIRERNIVFKISMCNKALFNCVY